MNNYSKIYQHYESCLEKHGDNHLGVDWPNLKDLYLRYKVMLNIIREDERIRILDFGCGTAMLNQYIIDNNININYLGLDISHKFIEICKQKYPKINFYVLDILKNPELIPSYDYAICNGTFTEKRDLKQNEMFIFFTSIISLLFAKCKKGIAFNVMSNNVDYKKDDLFYVSHDELVNFIIKNLTRNYIIRNDYGLYEYTVYIYKEKYNI